MLSDFFWLGKKTLHVKTFPCKILIFQVYALTHMYIYIYIHVNMTYIHAYIQIYLYHPFVTVSIPHTGGFARAWCNQGVKDVRRGPKNAEVFLGKCFFDNQPSRLTFKLFWGWWRFIRKEKKHIITLTKIKWLREPWCFFWRQKCHKFLGDVLVCWGTISLVQVSVFWGEEILVFWGFCLYTSTTLLEMIFAVIKNDFGIRFGVFPIRSCNNQNSKFQGFHKRSTKISPLPPHPKKKTHTHTFKKLRAQTPSL